MNITLNHGDKVIINGKIGILSTLRGLAKERGEDEETVIKRYIEDANKYHYTFEPYWVNLAPFYIYGDEGYFEYKRKLRKDAIQLTEGQEVNIEGGLVKVHYKGNYSDIVSFIPCK